MATITTDTFLDGGTARAAGETWVINGGVLTIRTDTRVHANAPASMLGSIGLTNISSTLGGGVLLDGRNVREVWFDSGSSTVPAIGTTITQGGVSGYLLGVWPDLSSAPLASGAAMPATGMIKFREVTGGNFAAGSLTGITANALGADVPSWIEVVQDITAANTVPRLGAFRTRGTWYTLPQVTSGSANQTIQIPSNGGGTGTSVACVWIETAPGSDVYEKFPAIRSTWFLAANISTDARGKFVKMHTDGQVIIGHDGAANAGYVPPAGCKIRIPNILGRQTSSVNRALNLNPHATLSSRPDFSTTASGEIDFEYFMNDWYHVFASAYKVTIKHCATMDIHYSSNEASPTDIEDFANGIFLGTSIALTLLNNSLGGTVKDSVFYRGAAASSGHNMSFTGCSNYLLDNIESGLIQYARSTGAAYFSQCRNFEIKNIRTTAAPLSITNCQNINVDGYDFLDRLLGNTIATTALYSVSTTASSNNVQVSNITLGRNGTFTNNHPYNGLWSGSNCSNITIRNAGTFAAPIGGSINPPAYLFRDSGNNDGIRIQRCYLTATRSNLFLTVNTSKNITVENCSGTTGSLQTLSINSRIKGVRCASSSTTGGSSVYGTHFFDQFNSDTTGRVWLAFNEPTEFSADQYEAVSLGVGAGFTSSGRISMPNVGDQVIFTMPYFAIGHTAFQNVAPTITATNPANFTSEYDVDLGTGFSGTFKTLNATNLSGETIDPAIGFKLKIRVTTITASATNAMVYVRVSTDSTAIAQANNLYVLDTASIKISGLRNSSRVQLYDTTNDVELYNDIPSGTELNYAAPYDSDFTVRVRVMYADSVTADKFIEFSDTVTVNGLSRSVTPEVDQVYTDNGIDGFTLTGIAIDDSALLVNIDTDTLSWSQIYAYETYWLYTEEGIRDETRFITAIDSANYLLEGFKIKNISSPSEPLTITGGWGRDDLTGQTVTLIDTSGGTIFSNPDLVISLDVGSGLSPSEQITLSKLDTLTEDVSGLRFTTKALETAPVGSAPTAVEIADAAANKIFDNEDVEVGYTLRKSLRLMLSALSGKISGAGTPTVTIRNVTDTKDRIVAGVDVDGNRTSIATDVD